MFNCSRVPKQDKGCHFIAGFMIAVITVLFFGSPWGMVAGILAGILKEMWDEYKYKNYDTEDMMFTFAGAIFGCLLFKLLMT